MQRRLSEVDIAPYEGLVFRTTQMIVGFVDDEFEDIQQQFRLKVATALTRFDPSRSKMTQDAYVFGCLFNLKKDILNRRRRDVLMIEDLAGDASDERNASARHKFELRYLVTSAEEVYGDIDEEGFTLPSTLSSEERTIVAWLYAGRMQIEAAAALGMTKGEMERAMRSIRLKLADWAPSAAPVLLALLPPDSEESLPQAA